MSMGCIVGGFVETNGPQAVRAVSLSASFAVCSVPVASGLPVLFARVQAIHWGLFRSKHSNGNVARCMDRTGPLQKGGAVRLRQVALATLRQTLAEPLPR
eukprot:scaffold138156_cov51-Prasinocladus_malaysianus.AAC.1